MKIIMVMLTQKNIIIEEAQGSRPFILDKFVQNIDSAIIRCERKVLFVLVNFGIFQNFKVQKAVLCVNSKSTLKL